MSNLTANQTFFANLSKHDILLHMKQKKKIWWIVGIVIAVILIADFGATWYFYGVAAVRSDKPVGQVAKSSPNYGLVTKFDQLGKTTKYITNDNIKFDAWYVPAAEKTNKTVVVVHGFRQDKSAMRQYGELFHEMGYNVLMPDNRGSGASGGKFITYGYYDKSDVIAWTKMLSKENPNSQITLFGLSMGASTVMMASGQSDLPSTVKNIIEDCGYDDVWSEICYQAKQMYNLPKFPLLYQVSAMSQMRAGWNFQEASATKELAKDELPILFIHGGDDTYVPTEMVHKNYEAVKSDVPKEILIVPKAIHAKSFETDPALYTKTVQNFQNKYNPVK